MENCNLCTKTVTLDDLGRLLIPAKLRAEAGWDTASPISATIGGNCISLSACPDGELHLDKAGCLTLPSEMRKTLGWEKGDKIELKTNGGVIELMLVEKN